MKLNENSGSCKGSQHMATPQRAGFRKHLNVVIIQLTKTHRFTFPLGGALFVPGLVFH